MSPRNSFVFTNIVVILTYFLVNPVIAEENRSLFARLGDMEQITEVVSETIDRTSGDSRAARVFEGIRLSSVKESVAQHLCDISGGPCKYEGASMAKAHTDLAITSEQFELMDAYLIQALISRDVSQADIAELGKLLSAMKGDVVGR